MGLHVAVVTRDPDIRERAARCFDGAPQGWRITLNDGYPENADVVITGPDVAPKGDLIFDPSTDLVAAVRSLSKATVRRVRIGGMPGSGRTSVAIHLAAALARTAAVCLVDRDPWLGVAHRLLIDQPRVFRDGDDPALAAVPSRGGFRLLSVPESGIDPTDAIGERFDALVLDGCAPVESDVVLLQPTLPQARRLRTVLGDARPLIVTNRLGRGGESTRRALEHVLGRRIALELPHTPALRDAEDVGSLAPSWTRWRRAVERLARALAP